MKRLDRRDHVDDVFDQMQEMFKNFQDFGEDLAFGGNVPVDIMEEEGKVIINADLPGVEKENINLKADQEGVEIAAESSHEYKEENEKYVRQERSSRSFRRKVRWPSEIDPETITAEYEDGVLTVEAEKEESEDWDIEIE